MKPMTQLEMDKLVAKYFEKDGYAFPSHFEHRYDDHSSAQCYSLIRKYKPTSCLEFGTSRGGSTRFIIAALLKNKADFKFVGSEMEEELLNETKKNVSDIADKRVKLVSRIEDNLKHVPKELDFVFIDTNHDLDNTRWYIENIFPRIKTGSLVAIHDWAVKEEKGELIGKGHEGVGGWAETDYLMDLIRAGDFPLEKLYWNYEEGGNREASFWIKK